MHPTEFERVAKADLIKRFKALGLDKSWDIRPATRFEDECEGFDIFMRHKESGLALNPDLTMNDFEGKVAQTLKRIRAHKGKNFNRGAILYQEDVEDILLWDRDPRKVLLRGVRHHQKVMAEVSKLLKKSKAEQDLYIWEHGHRDR